MQSWHSQRFAKTIHLTRHARQRMEQRGLAQSEIAALVETGTVKQKDAEHWWIFKAFIDRNDNLVCAAVVSRETIIIKTIMIHWEERDG